MPETKRKRAKAHTPKPHPTAFIADQPCPHCGCEWTRPGMTWRDGEEEEPEFGPICANLWCPVIRQLCVGMQMLAKLAADTPQFNNPLHVAEAQELRDHVLAGKLKVTVENTLEGGRNV